MAAFPVDGTARLWIDYSVKSDPHSAMFRFNEVIEAINAASVFSTLVAANLGSFSVSTTFTGARVAAVGTGVSNPVDFTPRTGTGGSAMEDNLRPRFVERPGRGVSGSKVRYFLFGMYPSNGTPGDFRVGPEEDANLWAYWSDFEDWASEVGLVTAADDPPVLKSYLNVALSGYWQRKLRG